MNPFSGSLTVGSRKVLMNVGIDQDSPLLIVSSTLNTTGLTNSTPMYAPNLSTTSKLDDPFRYRDKSLAMGYYYND